MSAPAIPLNVLVNAQKALQAVRVSQDVTPETRLLVAASLGELGYYVEKLLAEHDAAVRMPALSLVPTAPEAA